MPLQDLSQLAAQGFKIIQLIAHIPVEILKALFSFCELLLQSLFLFGFERGSGKTAFAEPILKVVPLVQALRSIALKVNHGIKTNLWPAAKTKPSFKVSGFESDSISSVDPLDQIPAV